MVKLCDNNILGSTWCVPVTADTENDVDNIVNNCYRFKDGLSVLGLLEAVKQHPTLFKPLLCFTPEALTADIVANLFQPTMSEPGSNRRTSENVIYSFWLDYLKDSEGDCCLIPSLCYSNVSVT